MNPHSLVWPGFISQLLTMIHIQFEKLSFNVLLSWWRLIGIGGSTCWLRNSCLCPFLTIGFAIFHFRLDEAKYHFGKVCSSAGASS